jgi:hypothetical protein
LLFFFFGWFSADSTDSDEEASPQWLGDSSQLLLNDRLDVVGVRINTIFRLICCSACGYSLTDWRAHLQRKHKRHVNDADALYVSDAFAAVPPPAANPTANAPIQGLRTMSGQACTTPNCSFVTGSTLDKNKHKHRAYAYVTLQQRERRSPYIQVRSMRESNSS